MRRPVLLLLTLAACVTTACSGPPPAVQRSGTLPPGGAMIVKNMTGDIDAYAPARNEPRGGYAIAAYASSASAATVVTARMLVRVQANVDGVRFLLRAPANTTLTLDTRQGNINVQDYDGVVNAHTQRGDIKMLIPAYGNAYAENGNVSVIFASTTWNGTLHFAADTGNVEVYVNENAKARVRMHTDNGTVFSDFPITGTSSGTGETIDAPINGGGPRGIDVEVHRGSIRVMQLKPQV